MFWASVFYLEEHLSHTAYENAVAIWNNTSMNAPTC